MKTVWTAAIIAALFTSQVPGGEPQRDVLSIDYSKDQGLVAAAYRGGQVVVWDFDSGQVRHVYNESAAKSTLNEPLAHFSPGGKHLAFTQEGDAGLVSYDAEGSAPTVLVPSRLLVKGITAFSWSQADTMLVAIGRDVFLINAHGHELWQRRLETRAIITDVVWHPSEMFYTVATDNGEISTWEASTGRVTGAAQLDTGAHAAAVKIGWISEDTLVAVVRGVSLAVLDPETLKPKRTTSCDCRDFTWSPGGKEILAWLPPQIAIFSEAGQRTREVRTPFAGEGPIAWAGDGRLLTGFSDSTVVLRDARSGKVLRTFSP